MFRSTAWMLVSLVSLVCVQAGFGGPGMEAADPPARVEKFVGSSVCIGCHAKNGNSWNHSLHARFIRTMEEEMKSPVVNWSSVPSAPFDTGKVAYVMGNMYKVVFLSSTEEGHKFLPKEFDMKTMTWEDFDANRWVAAGSDGEASAKATWETLCAGCHVTEFRAESGSFLSANIGCENCHGPGSLHAMSKKKDDIVNPAALPGNRGNHVCARCHSQGRDARTGRAYPVDFKAGDDLEATFTLDRPVPGTNSPGFWGNGMARTHHAQYNELKQSMHHSNDVKCFDCHQVHRSREASSSGKTRLMAMTERHLLKSRVRFVCMNCHEDRSVSYVQETPHGEIVDTHTSHPAVIRQSASSAKGAGAERAVLAPMTCQNCHMVKSVGRERGYETSSHNFHVPAPQDTIDFGAPNACSNCHDKQDARWALDRIAEWRKLRHGAPAKGAATDKSR